MGLNGRGVSRRSSMRRRQYFFFGGEGCPFYELNCCSDEERQECSGIEEVVELLVQSPELVERLRRDEIPPCKDSLLRFLREAGTKEEFYSMLQGLYAGSGNYGKNG